MRAIAALAVLGWHTWVPVLPGGSLGVDVFFVLSGYLITRLAAEEIDRTGALDYRAFLVRRARRLLPALIVMLAAYLALAPVLLETWAPTRWRDTALAGGYAMNAAMAVRPADTPLQHSWTLAGEAQFYLIFPLGLLVLLRRAPARAPQILLAAWLVLTAARSAWLLAGGAEPVAKYALVFQSTGLLLGAALALKPVSFRHGGIALGVIALLFAGAQTRFEGQFGWSQPLVEIATAMVLMDPPRLLAWRPLAAIGKISYGVYLWHLPIFFAVIALPREVRPPVVLALTLIVAALSYLLVERRFLSRRPNPWTWPALKPG